ncbi:MAG: MBL fold metallo-hydrolase [Deltaproteobacteria bacterium]|nr:MBL fold metallo-hydrolase [Deltaproteobacteria bacterium]
MTRHDASSGTILRFLGGAGTVTGSRFLVDTGRARVLVDCGLYQGAKALRERNWAPFEEDPASIDAVLLTHAHVDHSGYLPRLHQLGFHGPVYTSRSSEQLCNVLLRDSARLQEEAARYANLKGFSKHDPALPLYTEADAEAVLKRFRAVEFGDPLDVAEGVNASFARAGHILGSATLCLAVEAGPRIGFSGDLGREAHPLLLPPEPPADVDVMLVESTYGNRTHREDHAVNRLALAIGRTAARGGVTVIPAFAVDRTEIVLLTLGRLMDTQRIPRLPIYVDSPMALAALAIYRREIQSGSQEIRPEMRGQGNPFDPGTLVETPSVQESREINDITEPAIIISASGMATGGRILHHLARRLPDHRNSVVLVGYQAIGTRGHRLLSGEKTLKMLGRYIPVRAEIVDISEFSVHADRDELVAWLRRAPSPPALSFVVHGEADAAAGLQRAISDSLGWFAVVPKLGERVRVGPR